MVVAQWFTIQLIDQTLFIPTGRWAIVLCLSRISIVSLIKLIGLTHVR